MEYGLGLAAKTDVVKAVVDVLILVLMEYGLGHGGTFADEATLKRLNPCFNGIWSRTTDDRPYGQRGMES